MKFLNYIPLHTRPYLLGLIHRESVVISLSKERNGKWGDFRPSQGKEPHRITINENLNTWEFFLTLVHEIAHLKTWNIYKHKASPHGKEWKAVFKQYGTHLIMQNLLPPRIALSLQKHLDSPKSSICYDISMMKELSAYHVHESSESHYLHDVPLATPFEYQNRVFTKHKAMRTRCLCTEVKTHKQFYIHHTAEVRTLNCS